MIRVSFIIATFNRRDVLISTLGEINRCGLPPDDFEIHVVDNGSTDGTAEAISEAMGGTLASGCVITVHLSSSNLGACAKNIAIAHTRGEFIVFLDDDSFPQPGSIQRMIRHFDSDPQLGAASFNVQLPDGTRECSAFPNVFIGCGVGLRRVAIDEVGGLPDQFFMQAEEYDLSLRLLNACWDVRSLDDLSVTHLKTPLARVNNRTLRLDVRNNLLLIGRYFPARYAVPCCVSWLGRYWLIASKNRRRTAFLRGLISGSIAVSRCQRKPISLAAFERFARFGEIRQAMRQMRRQYRLRKILLIDVGKNILAYQLAARACGLRIVAIADNRLAGCNFFGTRILSDADARAMTFDCAIVSNSSPVHASDRLAEWRAMDVRPIIDLLETAGSASMVIAA